MKHIPNLPEIDDIEIIDAHGHVGSITDEGGGEIINETGLRVGHRLFDTARVLNWLKYESGKELKEPSAFLKRMAISSGKARIAGASLENMRTALDQSGISNVCCLPVPPYVTFEDVKKASQADPRIIPFTGIDFDDMEGMAAKLRQDIDDGACGIKIHPILQQISPDDNKVHEVLEETNRYGLPILFHTGVTSYHLDEEGKKRESTQFGRMELMKKLVSETRTDIPIILGHAGIFQFEDALEMGRQYPNIYADTTFQSPGRTQKLLDDFGTDRVVYGADWPYGDITPAINRTLEALAKGGYSRQDITKVLGGNIKDLIQTSPAS